MHSIGNLAKSSGISVRTLRYYDEIGLLMPSKVGEAGRRYYDNEAVVKLHTIIALKDLGFGLKKVQEIIDQTRSLKESLQMRLDILKMEQENLVKKEKSVRYVLQVMELEDVSNWETVYETIFGQDLNENEIEKSWSTNFSSDEKQTLNNLPKFGLKDDKTERFIKLIRGIRENLDNDPTSKEAQRLARRWMQLTDDIYNGNWELAQKAWKFSKEQGQNSGFYQFDKEVVDYIEKAIEHMYAIQEESDSDEETRYSP